MEVSAELKIRCRDLESSDVLALNEQISALGLTTHDLLSKIHPVEGDTDALDLVFEFNSIQKTLSVIYALRSKPSLGCNGVKVKLYTKDEGSKPSYKGEKSGG